MFTPSPEQEQLRSIVRAFFADVSPEPVVRQTMAGNAGFDPLLWRRMAQELGLLGMCVPEEHGGSGFGFAESCLVLEEAGRALVCAPLLSTLGLAVNVLLHAADDRARAELLPPLISGELLVAVSLPGARQRVRVNDASLEGTCGAVLDAGTADVLLALLPGADGCVLYEVDLRAAGVERQPLQTLDLTRRAATVHLRGVPARLVAHVAKHVLDRICDLAVVCLAVEQVGGAQRALEGSVAYARERVQFGRPIGSFQAVKHRLADMLVAVETARSAAYAAVGAAADGSDADLASAASLAGSYCSEVFSQVAEDALQVHGGIGFTWEHTAHLWLRRAKADVVLFGTPTAHRARLSKLIS